MGTDIWTPRVTVAAVVEREGRFLLVEEATEEGVVFNQPAGHLEDGENLLDAVRREVLEETCRTFQPDGLIGVYRWRMPDRGRTYLRFCFHGRCSARDPRLSLDEGILGTLWLGRAELAATARLRSHLVLACIDDYLAGRSFPLDLLRDPCPSPLVGS
jgi:ADP-ribose pyrophosphatase YjhB (NUDIX family)